MLMVAFEFSAGRVELQETMYGLPSKPAARVVIAVSEHLGSVVTTVVAQVICPGLSLPIGSPVAYGASGNP